MKVFSNIILVGLFTSITSAHASISPKQEMENVERAKEAIAIAELDRSEMMEKEFEGKGQNYEVASNGAFAAKHEAENSGRCRTYSGVASTYNEGSKTANGEHFYPNGMTAAHRSLPFGTRLHVTNKANGRSVDVRINDRGPFIRGRVLDLAAGAARAIGLDLGTVTFTACR
jgi:rare lipoprotein A